MSVSTVLINSTVFLIANLESSIDFAPVHTSLPELKIHAAVLGSLSLKTNPGNCSRLKLTPSKA